MRFRGCGVALCWLGFALFVASLALKAAGTRDACPYRWCAACAARTPYQRCAAGTPYRDRVFLPLVREHDMALLEDTPVLLVAGRAGAPRTPPRELRLLDPAGPVAAEVRVNHPLRWHGWWIYDAGEGFVAIRDPYWPLAALGGALSLLGALCGVLLSVPRTVRAPADASSAKH